MPNQGFQVSSPAAVAELVTTTSQGSVTADKIDI